MVNCPAFFKVFLPEKSARELEIPSSFIQSIQGALPKDVIIRDRYGNLWPVKVEKADSNWYFKDGWKKCVSDNSIQGGDILVFEYSHEKLFDIKNFGPSACEKKGVGDPKCGKTEEPDKMAEEEDNDEDEAGDKDFGATSRNQNEREEQEINGGATTGGNPCKNRKANDLYGAEIFRAGLAPQPMNPYFVTNVKQTRKSELHIPTDLVKDQHLELPQEMCLIDPTGRKFSTTRKIWKDGRVLYSGGWKSLCDMNLLEKEDFCICEFVEGGSGDLQLSVSFVRAVRHQD